MTVVDLARHAANQIGEMLNQKVGVKIFTDSLATLESIASTHQVQRRLMRASIADLKQKLEEKEVESYGWLQDEDMVADILTKEMKDKFGVSGILRDNKLKCVKTSDNTVTVEDGEFVMKGRKLREKAMKKNKA